MQAEEDGQRPALFEEPDLDGEHYPDVPPMEERPTTGGEQRVPMHRRCGNAFARVAAKCVINHEAQDALRTQALDDQARQRQTDLIRRPARTRR